MKIVIFPSSFGKYSEEPVRILRDNGIQFDCLPNPDMDESNLIRILEHYDGVILGLEPITNNILEACPNLKVIARYGVGMDNVNVETARARGVICTNTSGVNAAAVAEHTVGLMIDLSHRITESHMDLKNGTVKKFYTKQLSGATLGIIGFGPIALETIKRASAFEMKVLVYSHYRDYENAEKYGFNYVEKEEILKCSDYISLHCKLTKENRKIINAAAFNLMKPTAFLINCGRGGLVDEEALYNALTNGIIAGAGLDVFEEEPPLNSKLLHLNNVIATPHIAGKSEQALSMMAVMCSNSIVKSLQNAQ